MMPVEAIAKLINQSNSGNAQAQLELGLRYLSDGDRVELSDGDGADEYYAQAVKWLEKAAEQGVAEAQYNLGWCYEYGIGVGNDLKKAAQYYIAAAEKKHVYVGYNLGRCYEYGIGVGKDIAMARTLYQRAAEHGCESAQQALITLGSGNQNTIANDELPKDTKVEEPVSQAQLIEENKQKSLRAIDEILSNLRSQLNNSGTKSSTAQEKIEALLDGLDNARELYAKASINDEKKAQDLFKANCTTAIEEATPYMENELGLGDILMNALKALINAVIWTATLGNKSAFFSYARPSAKLVEDSKDNLNKPFQ